MTRIFDDQPAVREKVPLLVALFGPSGSGKTFSALRLAEGMQAVTGGDIFVIDTEGRRAKAYADYFKFRHIDFKAPFGSLDYLEAAKHCVGKGAGVVVVDSMSHEHEGEGGYLATQEAELKRLAGDDDAKRERVKFSAWIKPSTERRKLINGILQLNCNFIFCFRAKDKIKPIPGKQPQHLGYMPISGDEFLFEMTAAALLLPGAEGRPTWRPTNQGERAMVKLPQQFQQGVFGDAPLDQRAGQRMAEWASGASIEGKSEQVREGSVSEEEEVARLKQVGSEAADRGMGPLGAFWNGRTPAEKAALGGKAALDAWKVRAAEADAAAIEGEASDAAA